MKVYDVILQSVEKSFAIEYLHLFDFSETEIIKFTPNMQFIDFISEHEGVKMYYDIAACYYFFALNTEDDI